MIFGALAVEERWNKILLKWRSIMMKKILSVTEYKLQLALRQVYECLALECNLYRHVPCLFIIRSAAIYT